MLSVLMQYVKMFGFGGLKKQKKSQFPTFQMPRFSGERRFTSLVLLLQCRRLGWTPGKATRRIWRKCRASKFIVRIWASAFLPVKRDFFVAKTLSQKPTSTPPYFSSLLVCCDELTGRKVLTRDSDRTGSASDWPGLSVSWEPLRRCQTAVRQRQHCRLPIGHSTFLRDENRKREPGFGFRGWFVWTRDKSRSAICIMSGKMCVF